MNISGIKLRPALFRHCIYKNITCSVRTKFWKEAVVQYDFCQLYNLIFGEFCLVFPGVIRLQLALDDF